MIGVAVHPHERAIVQEFFELFKTPWEYYRAGRLYDVLVCTLPDWKPGAGVKLSLLYQGGRTAFDDSHAIPVTSGGPPGTACAFAFDQRRLPIYGRHVVFPANDFSTAHPERAGDSLSFFVASPGASVVRLGYDLFQEVRQLLTVGQPPANAGTPALELHIAFLREMILRSGIALVEIPPVPDGYQFVACLTHDIDHPILRNHWFDHTMLGFLYRATVGALVEVGRGRRPFKHLWQNLGAAWQLPWIHLGIAADPWSGFDRYLDLEAGLGATYFVIPRKDDPGRNPDGGISAKRAAHYTLGEILPQLQRIRSHGGEIGLHGIDAWCDAAAGPAERGELARVLGPEAGGVRMHWLFFDADSPGVLDRAGFAYDSSFGYNETVGYRAGTAQVYRPPGTVQLLELPLHIMDTALFYPGYLNLSDAGAEKVVWPLLDDALRFGGVLTINWHDRSIAPERLWLDFYLKLLAELKRRGAWLPPAGQAVAWFRKRRSVVFGAVPGAPDAISISAAPGADPELPALKARWHRPKGRNLGEPVLATDSAPFADVGFQDALPARLAV